MPTHPDRCGGLGFLASVVHAFSPLLLAQGTVLAGMMANRIFYLGATAARIQGGADRAGGGDGVRRARAAARVQPELEAAKRKGLREHGGWRSATCATTIANGCREVRRRTSHCVGSADIQSLADLSNSFEVVKDMRWVPFTLPTVLQLAVTTLLPVLPLMLTMISLEELLERLIKMVF